MKKPISIYLVDDHELVNNGIQNLLNIQNDKYNVSKVFNNAKDLLYALNFEQPNLIISDISMPNMNGIEMVKEVMAKFSEIKVLFLSMHKDAEFVKPALATGAQGYVLKDSKPQDVFDAIDTIMDGGNYISPKASSALLQNFRVKIELTPREIDILKLIGKGNTTKETAEILFISAHTVESHRKNLLAKTECTNIAELMVWAIREGYIDVSTNS